MNDFGKDSRGSPIEAIKMLALVNGAAAVAILAYLGNIAGHASAAHQPNMVRPLVMVFCGCIGVRNDVDSRVFHPATSFFRKSATELTVNPLVSATDMVSHLDLCCFSSRRSLSVSDM
jgi:hypothetical protein